MSCSTKFFRFGAKNGQPREIWTILKKLAFTESKRTMHTKWFFLFLYKNIGWKAFLQNWNEKIRGHASSLPLPLCCILRH